MAAKAKTPEDWISFLLTCMDYTPAKPDWNKIAQETGSYKAGKYVLQAYTGIRKKYNPLPLVDGADAVPPTPKSNKKRAAADNLDEDEEELNKTSKRARKTKSTPKKEAKGVKEAKEELASAKISNINVEDDDEANENASGDEDADELED